MFSGMPSGITGGGGGTLGIGTGMLLSGLIGTVGQGISNFITRKREDTAVQRRAADMEAAGINPTLAAGSPAQAQPLKGASTEGVEKAALALSMMKMKADVGLANAQTHNVEADTTAKNLANQYAGNTLDDRTLQARALSMLDQNKYYAESAIRDFYDAKGVHHQGNVAEMRAVAESYDVMLRSSNAYQAEMATLLKEQAFNLCRDKGLNPDISEILSKAIAANILRKEEAWFERKAWMQAGSSAIGMGKDVFTGLYGGKGIIPR